jgi:fermentation-respiration switch protein FrsA (DUF1100 family)
MIKMKQTQLKPIKIYFSHGKKGTPNGHKIASLMAIANRHGCETQSIDYTATLNPDLRAEQLLNILTSEQPNQDLIYVGSSMGAYVSLLASLQFPSIGMFLMSPALYFQGYKVQNFPQTFPDVEIIHGWQDEVIPVANCIKFAQEHQYYLHLVNDGHQLAHSMDKIEHLFDLFLQRILTNRLES